jgi:hypothetical protein
MAWNPGRLQDITSVDHGIRRIGFTAANDG